MDYNLFYSKTEYPYPSTTTSELDFVQHWVENTVEKEIIRGKQLQQLKEIKPIVKEYDVVNVDHGKLPYCEPSGFQSTKKPQKKKQNRRIHKSKKGKNEKSVCTCCSPKSNRKRKIKPKCPMRIAELAVPTKRQCLQNWINNKHILPETMIDRLQQIIRDQRPVVKISDAIICFKTHRSKRKRKSKECEKKDKKCFAKNINKAKNLSDARVFCGVFGYMIGQKLNKPMVIQLSSELESLAKVVTMDISDLLWKKQRDFGKITKKKSMLDEISSKIAIWIWSILDDTDRLILEEKLEELEDEIGPVLDIIDDLVDSVVDMCYVEPIFEDISNESSIKDEDLEQGEEVAEEHVPSELSEAETNKDIHQTDSLTDLDRPSDEDTVTHISNQIICSIVNNIISDDDSDQLSNILLDQNVSEKSFDDKEFVDADDDNFPKPSEQIENTEDRDEEGNQVSDDFNDGKKVTFSQLNTVNTKSPDPSAEDEGDISKVLNWKDSLNAIVFAEPNDNLLSDADELWPRDINYEDIVKYTLTMNKSISSMGKIIEKEEKTSVPPTEDIFDHNTIEPNASQNLYERELDSEELDNKELDNEELDNKELDNKELDNKELDNKELDNKELDNNELDNKELDNEELEKEELDEIKIPQLNYDINYKLFKEITESKAVQTSIDKTNFSYYKKLRDAGINTSPSSSVTSRRKKGKTVTSLSLADFSKKPTKPKLNYKVCPSTAPAWAMIGFYESNEGSSHKIKMNPCQIRKWCNDLQTGCNNLKLWGNWLDETCRTVIKLELNKAKCCPNNRKQATKWIKLKKEIDDDASIWNKKYRCTSKLLAAYKDLYCDQLLCICTNNSNTIDYSSNWTRINVSATKNKL